MIPDDRVYTEKHEWLKIEDGVAVLGITDFAQQELGDVVFVDFFPERGEKIMAGDELGAIESVKAVAEFYTPLTGSVEALNYKLEAAPELVNEDPYGGGWLVRLQLFGEVPSDAVLTAAAYEAMLAG